MVWDKVMKNGRMELIDSAYQYYFRWLTVANTKMIEFR